MVSLSLFHFNVPHTHTSDTTPRSFLSLPHNNMQTLIKFVRMSFGISTEQRKQNERDEREGGKIEYNEMINKSK